MSVCVGNRKQAERLICQKFGVCGRSARRYIKAVQRRWAIEAAIDLTGDHRAKVKAQIHRVFARAIKIADAKRDVIGMVMAGKALAELHGSNAAIVAKIMAGRSPEDLTDPELDAQLAAIGYVKAPKPLRETN